MICHSALFSLTVVEVTCFLKSARVETVQGFPTTTHHLVGQGPSFLLFLPRLLLVLSLDVSSSGQIIASLCTPHTPLPYFLSSLCNSSAFHVASLNPVCSNPLHPSLYPQAAAAQSGLRGESRGFGMGGVGGEQAWLVREPLVMLDEGDWKEGREAAVLTSHLLGQQETSFKTSST